MNYVATFHTHLAAMMTRSALQKIGVSGRLAPVPRRLSSSCGTCLLYTGDDPCLSHMDRDTEAVYQEENGGYTCLFENK